MKRAIVLSGGGAKGAYELGVWKALRKLGIDFDIVTGTSIGALNGAMMVQNDYAKCLKTWYFMNYDYVSKMEIKGKFSSPTGRKEIIKKYTKGALTGGLEMDGLKEIIDYSIDTDVFLNSNIDYGLVTTTFPAFKGKFVKKSDMNKDNIKDYLLASASCFPAFKPTKIKNTLYIDGGYTDNIPINLAIDLGADEVIVVDMGAIGINKKNVKKDIPITVIKPSSKLGNLLVFEKDYTREYMKLGYNDTMKLYSKFEGNKYTFKPGSLKRNYDRNGKRFYDLYDYYDKGLFNKKIKDKKTEFNKILETLLESFDISSSKVYRTSHANILLKKQIDKASGNSYAKTKKYLINKKLKNAFVSKDLILYIYNEINKNRNIKKLSIMFPKAFMCALYLKTIKR